MAENQNRRQIMDASARRRFLWIAGVALLVVCVGYFILAPSREAPSRYLVGTGIYDITGPAAECGMMGYSDDKQKTTGIHMRLRARAFVVADMDNGKRVAFVSAEAGIIPQGVKQGVVKKLLMKYRGLYTDANVAVSASHTHSGPGAYSHYALYDLSMGGYDKKHYETVVDGIYKAVVRAHDNLEPGRILINVGDLDDAGWNRSPLAYDNNPAAERAQYATNTDKTMTLLRFVSADGTDLGTLNWFAVHPTSIGNTNKLITGDNKGYASYLFEKAKEADYAAKRTFVAAFAESNAGDVSPNIQWGYPDGKHDDSRMRTIGERQYTKARALFDDAEQALRGSVDYRHAYIDMSKQVISRGFMPGHVRDGRTCVAAIGISVLAGSTEDGKGPFPDMTEGITHPCKRQIPLPGWMKLVGGVASVVLPPDQGCHEEKPIYLATGRALRDDIPLTPEVLPVQILKIGNLAIVAQPTEITTMAGRRLMSTVKSALDGQVDHVVIAALSNAYASYVTTREEYAKQHYEGASTLFGPHTLNAFQEQFAAIATALRTGSEVPPGPKPREIGEDKLIPTVGVVFDNKPLGKEFGSVETDARAAYTRGQTVSVTFWGAHPKNDYRMQNTFLKVERITPSGAITVANDWDPETTYEWKRNLVARSKVTVTWDTTDATPGSYRIRHYGNWKSVKGKIAAYKGTSRTFKVR